VLGEVASEQMTRLAFQPTFFGLATPPTITLATKLAALYPGAINHFQFTSGGAESNETAIKIARYYWAIGGRPNKVKIVSRLMGYHGIALGALAATGIPGYWQDFGPLAPGFVHVSAPHAYRLGAGLSDEAFVAKLVAELEETIAREGADTIAAFLGEPVQGAGGVVPPPPGYWPAIKAVLDRHDILLIADEVITGFGRTGTMFGCEHWGIVPDIMTMAKGISSAYVPLAATAVSDAVFAAFLGDVKENVQFNQLSTYGGHPVACAVGLANLAVIEDDGLVANAAVMGERLRAGLRMVQGRRDVVGEVRGKGLLCGIELAQPGTTDPLPAEQVNRVIAAAQRHGVLIGKNSATVPRLECVLTLSPPLVITAEEVDRVVDAIDTALGEIG